MGMFRFKNLHSVETTQRIEAFSDGIFAIAITLLVLEMKVPESVHGAGVSSLKADLWNLWPSYCAYVLSFIMIGIYWANHHYIFHLYKRSDHVFAVLNVFFLMCISFLPFPTAVLAKHLNNPADCPIAIAFYAFGLLLPALTWLFVWLYASGGYRLLDRKLDEKFVRMLTGQYALSVVLYLLSLGASLVRPGLGLAICVGRTLLYLLPPKRPVYKG